jgi:hypothetical protein
VTGLNLIVSSHQASLFEGRSRHMPSTPRAPFPSTPVAFCISREFLLPVSGTPGSIRTDTAPCGPSGSISPQAALRSTSTSVSVLSPGGSLQLTLDFAEPSAKFAKLRQIGDQARAHTPVSNNSPAHDIAAERAGLTLVRRSTPSRRRAAASPQPHTSTRATTRRRALRRCDWSENEWGKGRPESSSPAL